MDTNVNLLWNCICQKLILKFKMILIFKTTIRFTVCDYNDDKTEHTDPHTEKIVGPTQTGVYYYLNI